MGKLWTVAPLYYLFVEQTRYAFTNTLRWEADYFVTNRAVSAKHVPFHEIFMSFSRSPCAGGRPPPPPDRVGLGDTPPAAFLLYLVYLFIVALLFTPFLYNPRAFYWPTLAKDLHLWVQWVGGGVSDAKGAAAKWAVWWERSAEGARARRHVAGGPGADGARLRLLRGATPPQSNSVWSEAAAYYFDVVDDETGGLGCFTTSLWQLSMGLALWTPPSSSSRTTSLRRRAGPSGSARSSSSSSARRRLGDLCDGRADQPALPGIAAVTPHGCSAVGLRLGAAPRLALQLLGACAARPRMCSLRPGLGPRPRRRAARRRPLLHPRATTCSFFLFAFLAALAIAVLPNFLQHEIIFQSSPYFVPKTWRSLCRARRHRRRDPPRPPRHLPGRRSPGPRDAVSEGRRIGVLVQLPSLLSTRPLRSLTSTVSQSSSTSSTCIPAISASSSFTSEQRSPLLWPC